MILHFHIFCSDTHAVTRNMLNLSLSFKVNVFTDPPTMAENYHCTLTEDSLKKAKEELHEDPKERLSSVSTFKDWITTQTHIKCGGGTIGS